MRALALATALSVILSHAVGAQDSQSSSSIDARKSSMIETASSSADVAAIQKKIENFSEGIKNEPKNDKWYAARGQSYWRIGKYELAHKDMNQAISLNSRKSSYFIVRGDTLSKLHREREAFEDYEKAISLGETSHYLYLQKGYCAAAFKDYRLADESAKRALKLNPLDIKTLALVGGVDRKLGRYHESLKYLDQAIALSPNDSILYRLRADTYNDMGKKELAARDLEAAKHFSRSSR